MPATHQPSVALVMGSDSDLPVLEGTISVLKELAVPLEVRVLSAHRTPEDLRNWLRDAEGKGLKVVIAAAGGAAHLAGTIAAHTTLPVIGIPVPAPPLQGIDALLSTIQMPGGIPVATVAIGPAGATNAGLLAAEILALSDRALSDRVRARRAADAEKVRAKDRAVREKYPPIP